MTELRGLLGYGLHLASCALHSASVELLVPPSFAPNPPRLWVARECLGCQGRGTMPLPGGRDYCTECGGNGEDATDIELADVAPFAARVVGAIARRCGHG